MGLEFYPRLSRVAGSEHRLRVFVSHEINIAFMVLTPLLLAMILLRSQLVWLLYSKEFEIIVTYMSWGAVGTLFRAMSWCMAFVMLAKGDGKIFLITETLSAVTVLVLNMLCFHLWGIDGLGYSYLASYALYTIIVGVVYFGVYKLTMSTRCFVNLLLALMVCVAMVVAVEMKAWAVAIGIFAVASALCLYLAYYSWKR